MRKLAVAGMPNKGVTVVISKMLSALKKLRLNIKGVLRLVGSWRCVQTRSLFEALFGFKNEPNDRL